MPTPGSRSWDVRQGVNRPGQFSFENGITVTVARPGYAEGVLSVRQSSHNPNGTVHGGCLYTLADTVAGSAACDPEHSCVTVNSSFEFLRPAYGPEIRCTATPKKLGRSLPVVQVTLTDAQEKVVATGTFTFLRREREVRE